MFKIISKIFVKTTTKNETETNGKTEMKNFEQNCKIGNEEFEGKGVEINEEIVNDDNGYH